jgi:hypothetical protein
MMMMMMMRSGVDQQAAERDGDLVDVLAWRGDESVRGASSRASVGMVRAAW